MAGKLFSNLDYAKRLYRSQACALFVRASYSAATVRTIAISDPVTGLTVATSVPGVEATNN